MSNRKDNFDALRLLGALLVLGSHQFALSGHWEPRLVGDHSFGNLGVLIFFSVSGYLVTQSWTRDPQVGRFLVRRALRLLPGLLVVMIASALALSVLLPPDSFAWRDYLLKAWSSQRAPYFIDHPQQALNGSLWTIPVEMRCYAVLCVIGWLAGRHLRAVVLGGLVALLVWYLAVFGGQTGFDRAVATGRLSFLPYFGAFFLLGAALSLWEPLRRRLAWLALGGGTCIALGEHTLGLVLVAVPAVVFVGERSWPVLREAGRFGDVSYGVYLYAWPTQQFIVRALGTGAGYWALLLPSLLASLLLGLLSWHLVEKRALRYKPQRRLAPAPLEAALVIPRE